MKKTKAISYALFGYERERAKDCFDFNSYLRGLLINIRLNRLLFPDWDIVLNIDHISYNNHKNLFDNLPIRIEVQPDGVPLCLAMLWRLKPLYLTDAAGVPDYTHVICRDLDSPPTYRERQCVEQWVAHDKAAHAICDSDSHNIPMMGGMVGFRPAYFTMRMPKDWDSLIAKDKAINYKTKGADQTFLNSVIYPAFATPGNDSITQHYMLGYPDTFLSDFSNKVPNIVLDLPEDMKKSNDICGHIGAAGYYPPPLEKFLHDYKDRFVDLQEIEKDYTHIFYWANDKIF